MSGAGVEFDPRPTATAHPLCLAPAVRTVGVGPHPALPLPAREAVATWPCLLRGSAPKPSGKQLFTAPAGLALVVLAVVRAMGLADPAREPTQREDASSWALRLGQARGALDLYKETCAARAVHAVPAVFRVRDDDALETYKAKFVTPWSANAYSTREAPGAAPPGLVWFPVPAELTGGATEWVGVTPAGVIPASTRHHAPDRWYFGGLHPDARLVTLFPHMKAVYEAARVAAAPLGDLVSVQPWFGGVRVLAKVPVCVGPPPTADTATFEVGMEALRLASVRIADAVSMFGPKDKALVLKDLTPRTLTQTAWSATRSYCVPVTHADVQTHWHGRRFRAVRSNTCACRGCAFTVLLKGPNPVDTAKDDAVPWLDTACSGPPVVVRRKVPTLKQHRRRRKAWSRERARRRAALESRRGDTPKPRKPRKPEPRPAFAVLMKRQPPAPARPSLDDFLHARGAGADAVDDGPLQFEDTTSRDATTATLDEGQALDRPLSPDQDVLTTFFAVVRKGSKRGSARDRPPSGKRVRV